MPDFDGEEVLLAFNLLETNFVKTDRSVVTVRLVQITERHLLL